MELGRLGVWCGTEHLTSPELAEFAQRIERWGYGTLWQPETAGRNVLVAASWLLANTSRLTVATGIANIYARDSLAAYAAQQGLAEQSGGRFLLGLGVSHANLVERLRKHTYGKPLTAMREYLDGMHRGVYKAPAPEHRPPTVLAALRPRMIELAAELADGAHTYNVTPEHTAEARRRLGPGKLLCPEQKVLLETDPAKARAVAREALGVYLGLKNYQESWRTFGFDEADWSGHGSDRLVDAMVAWGDEEAIRERLRQHWDAGADHVCIQPLGAPQGLDENVLARLAPSPGAGAR